MVSYRIIHHTVIMFPADVVSGSERVKIVSIHLTVKLRTRGYYVEVLIPLLTILPRLTVKITSIRDFYVD